MDEFGSRIQHSDEPSVQMVPFFYIPAGISFSLMWPTKKLKEGGNNERILSHTLRNFSQSQPQERITNNLSADEVTRDYAAGITDPNTRRARLLPWFDNDLTDIDWKLSQPEDSYFMVVLFIHPTCPLFVRGLCNSCNHQGDRLECVCVCVCVCYFLVMQLLPCLSCPRTL